MSNSTFTREMRAANSRRGRDEVDEAWDRAVRGESPQRVDFQNRFTPLATMLNDFSPTAWSEVEFALLGKVTTGLRTVAESCIKEEFCVVARPGCLRLNGTLPDSPELASVLGMVQDPDHEHVVHFGSDSQEAREWQAYGSHSRSTGKSQVTKEQRRRYVLDRVVRKLSALENGNLGLIQWLLLSPATPAWKKVVIREMVADGFLDVFGLQISTEFLFALAVVVAYKYRTIPCVLEAELSKKVAIAMENEDENPLLDLSVFPCLADDCHGWLQTCRLARQTINDSHQNMSSLLSAFAKFDYTRAPTDSE